MTDQARISLVTSVLDGEPHIAELLASVPRGLPVEHLVIDAGSTDGTLERLWNAPGLTLISRPGAPLYAAWNLALERASGDAIWFVNADDVLPPGAVEAVLEALERHPEADVIQGRAEAFDDHGGAGPARHAALRYPAPGDMLSALDLVFGAPVVNARIFRRRLVERVGPFRTEYGHAADREWLLRLLFADPPPECAGVDATVYRYRIHGGSMTLSPNPHRRLAMAQEHREIAARRLQGPTGDRASADLLGAWRARETLVGAITAMRLGKVATGARLAAGLVADVPGSTRQLIAARRHRRAYLERLATAGGPG